MASDKAVKRQFLSLFLPTMAFVLAAALLFGNARVTSDLDRLWAQEGNRVDVAMARLDDQFAEPWRHLHSVATEAATLAALRADAASIPPRDMAQSLWTLVRRDSQYAAALWIDQDGHEAVRVVAAPGDGDPVATTPQAPGLKAPRPSLAAAFQMMPGQVYVSPLIAAEPDIDGPHMWMAMPLADAAGARRGVLAFALKQDALFADLVHTPGYTDALLLLDRAGRPLGGMEPIHPLPPGDGRQSGFAARFPMVWGRMAQSPFGGWSDGSGLWTWRTIDPAVAGLPPGGSGEPHWIVASYRSRARVIALYAGVWVPTVAAGAGLSLILGLMSWHIASRSYARAQALGLVAAAETRAAEKSQRVAELEEAQRASAILAAIVRSSDDAIISKTSSGVITSWNPGAERLFGYRADEMIGGPVTVLFAPAQLAEENLILARIRRGETVGHFDTVRRHKDGRLIDVSITVSPILDGEGRIVGASKIARDISDRKRVAEELERHRQDLEELVEVRTAQIVATNRKLEVALAEANKANQAKSVFLANMGHELRTPMNAVMGFIGLALEQQLPAEPRRQLSAAQKAAKTLLGMISGILDLCRLQTGLTSLDPVVFDLRDLLDAALAPLNEKAGDKGLALTVHYAPDAGPSRIGDPARVRQLVEHLVGNAIKFTDAGAVTVSLHPAAEAGMVELSVTDTGIGMTAEQIERLFDPFFQADDTATRRHGGMGLGISISRELVTLMGGDIRVESQPGKGSAFHVRLWLPAAVATVPMAAKVVPLPNDRVPGSGWAAHRAFSILVADDRPESLEIMRHRLEKRGHRVMAARDGEEAVALARRQPFDIALMDIQMPRLCGLGATRRIRALDDGRNCAIPIIALSANMEAEEKRECALAGASAWLSKPVDFDQLAALMEHLVPGGDGAGTECLVDTVQALPEIRPFLVALRQALDTDDPDVIEPALAPLAAMAGGGYGVAKLGRLVAEFEFHQARVLTDLMLEDMGAGRQAPTDMEQGRLAHG